VNKEQFLCNRRQLGKKIGIVSGLYPDFSASLLLSTSFGKRRGSLLLPSSSSTFVEQLPGLLCNFLETWPGKFAAACLPHAEKCYPEKRGQDS